ncbi:MAG: MBL fold metallo-hydrolase [Rhodospirillales bacterium]|nr:MBL fold metallo-hydrolase [Rhodospirillales bacterium]
MSKNTCAKFAKACLVSVLIFAGTAHAQSEKKEITIGVVPVSGPISMLIGVNGFSGGNVGVSAGRDGMLIVDDKLDTFSHKLEKRLDDLKICSECGDLKFVINTHWHFDHAGGNAYFGDQAVIVAHDNVRKLMAAPQEIKFFKMKLPASPDQALPVITYAKSVSVHFNGEEIRVIHFPNGHTDGDSVVHFTKSNVLHLGDQFFNGLFPFVDLEHGGNVVSMTRNIGEMIKMFPADAKIIPGHGPLGDMAALKAFHAMLTQTTKIVKDRMAAGKSLTEIQAAGLPEKWKSWAWLINAESWIALVHGSLKP